MLKEGLIWLRIAYWAGLIADALVAILMLFPRFYVRFYGMDVAPDAAFGLGLRRAAPLMLGWSLLLLWADRKPVSSLVVEALFIGLFALGYVKGRALTRL